jgi:lipopolysaccharide transport system ATP-binding protein
VTAADHDRRITVEHLSYTYPGAPHERRRLYDRVAHPLRKRSRTPVLVDVNFSVDAGSCLGVIGRNGVGKSTLMKLLVGAMKPDAGNIRIAGRIAPLIGLGSGMHSECDADENALLMATAMGTSARDARAMLDDLISFAGLEAARHEPLRRYSSGMLARLAFAVATAVRPDVLLLDEVLAVGDYDFAVKARARIEELMSGETATVLVTHDMESVRTICDAAIWLDSGRVMAYGPSNDVVDEYLAWWRSSPLAATAEHDEEE